MGGRVECCKWIGSIGKRKNNILGLIEVRCQEVVLSRYWEVKVLLLEERTLSTLIPR